MESDSYILNETLREYTPDVLNCISHLSSDEVFTTPDMVNEVLDILPSDVWSDPTLRFLDPGTKTGVFLKQIAIRLFNGLAEKIPDEWERVNHILKNQVFGFAITELTGYVSRRTLYCSLRADSKFSLVDIFDNKDGNIVYVDLQHKIVNGFCIHCGISGKESSGTKQMDGEYESHAHIFTHVPRENLEQMNFDIIVGNPPYQLSDGCYGAGAKPIYHKFIERAIELNPKYFCFITPSRWFAGGKGLDSFRSKTLSDKRIKILVDYPDARDCFPNVEIKGGVSYFLWDRDYSGKCNIKTHLGKKEYRFNSRFLDENDVFIRFNQAIPILRKIQKHNEHTLDGNVLGQNVFGFWTDYTDYKKLDKEFTYNKNSSDHVKIYAKHNNIGIIKKSKVEKSQELIDQYNVLIGKSGSVNGSFPNKIIGTTIIAEPGSVCTGSFLVVGSFKNKLVAKNFQKYIKTRLFRFLLSLRTPTQDISRKCFKFIPDLPMNVEWTDEKLYEKYGINKTEQKFIESMIKEM